MFCGGTKTICESCIREVFNESNLKFPENPATIGIEVSKLSPLLLKRQVKLPADEGLQTTSDSEIEPVLSKLNLISLSL